MFIMHVSTFAFVLSAVAIHGIAAQTTGRLGDAAVINNNPIGASYIATLPANAFFTNAYPNGGNIQGTVEAVSSPDGQGVLFEIKLSNLPSEGGPFLYHLHDQPVSPDGNCSATLAHLDPYERGEATPCDITRPETCQVGDLSGKHGDINSNPWNATYTDYYASTLPGIGAFFGNRSLVIHFKNVTRITCANFTAVGTGSSGAPATMRPNTSTTSPTSFTTGMATPTSLSPVGSNTTGTGARPTTTFVTAAAATNVPAAILGIGAAVLAFAL